MSIEKLSEKWFNFTRYHFKKGFIDRCTLDSIDNPNQEKKSLLNLNSISTWVRLNGTGEWKSIMRSKFMTYDREKYTSEEVWKMIKEDLYHD